MQNTIQFLTNNPGKLFLIDSLGALLTAVMLHFVLRNFNEYFGMPKIVLACLALIAACFSLYSAICFFFLNVNWVFFLRIIAYANLSYCVLTFTLLGIYCVQITTFDLIYFLIEMGLIFTLVYFELRVVKVIE